MNSYESNEQGYKGICTEAGVFVKSEDAYPYALERIAGDRELQEEFVNWFYSGNFVKATLEGAEDGRNYC